MQATDEEKNSGSVIIKLLFFTVLFVYICAKNHTV